MQLQSGSARLVPPLMTSGALNPLVVRHARGCITSDSKEADRVTGSGLTNSYDDRDGTSSIAEGAYVDCRAVVHTDMTEFSIGAYFFVCAGAVLRPPVRVYVNQLSACAEPRVHVGSFVYVGEQVVCEAAEIGHMVRLDAQCVVSTGAHLSDGVWLLTRTWVPPEVALSPYTVYAGVPAAPVRKLNARSYQLLHMEFLRRRREASRRGVSLSSAPK
ncbi:hypothetical protein LSCM4_01986 [Leishmania orientalis]|uniref:Dynactin subunit 5 n=1 Tax=Leishmania orientalis TaxID=2249476 RepID=A0A836GVJ0_9TRYP|nr:hypothetical protein LSCM4_01986 [Leishmania orientalis]